MGKPLWQGQKFAPDARALAGFCHRAEQYCLQGLHNRKVGRGWYLTVESKPLPRGQVFGPWRKGDWLGGICWSHWTTGMCPRAHWHQGPPTALLAPEPQISDAPSLHHGARSKPLLLSLALPLLHRDPEKASQRTHPGFAKCGTGPSNLSLWLGQAIQCRPGKYHPKQSSGAI